MPSACSAASRRVNARFAAMASHYLFDTRTEWITLIPTTYNADTLGIRPDLVGKPIESWASLLEGLVALGLRTSKRGYTRPLAKEYKGRFGGERG